MPALGVNIDHIATLRNARGTTYPDILQAARMAIEAGADWITVHLREDRRHIRDADCWALRQIGHIPLNFECAVTEDMLAIAGQLLPEQVCLVPERREEITTEGGLDILANFDGVAAACSHLAKKNIVVSVFIDADARQIHAAQQAGAAAIELHTGPYANTCEKNPDLAQMELAKLRAGAALGRKLKLKVHAGHGLHEQNIHAVAALSDVTQLHIGHAIVAKALFVGWSEAIIAMKKIIATASSSSCKFLH